MRSRNIKPGFFKNELLCSLPPLNRLLFAGLWLIADRCGRIEERLERIRTELLPYDACKGRGNVDQMLQRLHDAGFILRYSVNGTKYIQIVKFSKHQNPHKEEKQSTIPAPYKPGAEHSTSTVQAQEIPVQVGLIPDSLIPDSLNLIPSSQNGAADFYNDDEDWLNHVVDPHPGRRPESAQPPKASAPPPEDPPFDYWEDRKKREAAAERKKQERAEDSAKLQAELKADPRIAALDAKIKASVAAKKAQEEAYKFDEEGYRAWEAAQKQA